MAVPDALMLVVTLRHGQLYNLRYGWYTPNTFSAFLAALISASLLLTPWPVPMITLHASRTVAE
jgi:hypothetical protein